MAIELALATVPFGFVLVRVRVQLASGLGLGLGNLEVSGLLIWYNILYHFRHQPRSRNGKMVMNQLSRSRTVQLTVDGDVLIVDLERLGSDHVSLTR